MPSLEESYPRLVAALTSFYGRPAVAEDGLSAFEKVLLVGSDRDPGGGGAHPLLAALDRAGLLKPSALGDASPHEVLDSLRDAGVRVPLPAAALLVRLARWYVDAFGDDEPVCVDGIGSDLRARLSQINGVGPTRVPAILLAVGVPEYPLDRASYRILIRHGWADPTTDPAEPGQALTELAARDHQAIRTLSGWFRRVGRQFCGPGTPRCARCPLCELLPESGPLEPDL